MEENFFLQNFENINEASIPSPIINHSSECRKFNSLRKKSRQGGTSPGALPKTGQGNRKEEKEEKEENEVEKEENEEKEEKEGKKDDDIEVDDEYPDEGKDNYLCINANAFNGKCYHKKIPILDDIHLRFTLGESLTYLLNAYLQRGLIKRVLYNKILHTFQIAIISILLQLKESRGNKWTIKGKLINFKKENNVQLLYVENAVLSFSKIVLHVPLLKIKSIDL
ncbi:hypothetical protein, conserved [Plasmodium gonderi]|uniref:Uncharacterized protein n=1 Tax=Plasmodium gonderi TaxID=77519 RepID=A0A1Y1JHZ4_PLAGO|nr:hypothetical protein, conserved [Plasmodium gonderi]GAW80402.1 hypothetical protein, conserved [Plasmodium gonderi]